MATPTTSMATQLERLSTRSLPELHNAWRRWHRRPPPARLSRDLLIRAIAYRMQETASGGLSKRLLRRLAQIEGDRGGSGSPRFLPPIALKPGTRLVREWRGITHTVLIHRDGVEWRGQRWRSLSVVAREITGAHWSGPRFFGLTSGRVGDGQSR